MRSDIVDLHPITWRWIPAFYFVPAHSDDLLVAVAVRNEITRQHGSRNAHFWAGAPRVGRDVQYKRVVVCCRYMAIHGVMPHTLPTNHHEVGVVKEDAAAHHPSSVFPFYASS